MSVVSFPMTPRLPASARGRGTSMSAVLDVPVVRAAGRGARAFASELRQGVPLLRDRAERAGAAASLHLTRRGRLVLAGVPVMTLALAVVALAVALLLSATVSAGVEELPGPSTATVTVSPGQSLWEIATLAQPGEDPRAVVAEIVELNELRSNEVHVGDQLLVPASSR